jgi:hypothetical protein
MGFPSVCVFPFAHPVSMQGIMAAQASSAHSFFFICIISTGIHASFPVQH